VLMAAAVADFRPAAPIAGKFKKDGGPPAPIELEPTDDVISDLAGRKRQSQLVIGFAAEHGDGALAYGADKLRRKRLDAVVVNDVSRPGIGFDAADNEVTILASDGTSITVPRAGKELVARAVLDEVERLRRRPVESEGANGARRASAGSATGV